MEKEKLTRGQKAADYICYHFGSWRFLGAQTVIFVAWMLWNRFSPHPFDPYPWLLLNLVLSFSAAYANSILQMSQNRLGQQDRELAKLDYLQNSKNSEQIECILTQLRLLSDQVNQLKQDK